MSYDIDENKSQKGFSGVNSLVSTAHAEGDAPKKVDAKENNEQILQITIFGKIICLWTFIAILFFIAVGVVAEDELENGFALSFLGGAIYSFLLGGMLYIFLGILRHVVILDESSTTKFATTGNRKNAEPPQTSTNLYQKGEIRKYIKYTSIKLICLSALITTIYFVILASFSWRPEEDVFPALGIVLICCLINTVILRGMLYIFQRIFQRNQVRSKNF